MMFPELSLVFFNMNETLNVWMVVGWIVVTCCLFCVPHNRTVSQLFPLLPGCRIDFDRCVSVWTKLCAAVASCGPPLCLIVSQRTDPHRRSLPGKNYLKQFSHLSEQTFTGYINRRSIWGTIGDISFIYSRFVIAIWLTVN